MDRFNSNPSRRSLRLPDYDYSQAGAYFITLVTHHRENIFGEIQNGEMIHNTAGYILWEIWKALPGRYPGIELDEAIVMPNHFHGIIIVKEVSGVAAIHELPQRKEDKEEYRLSRRRMLIPKVIGYLKMNSAKQINLLRDMTGSSVWQRNYYDHIIRNQKAFDAIRLYIKSNPYQWESDKENPSNRLP